MYAAGRLDADSEGLLLLTSNGRLQQRLTDPSFGHWRRYWVQVEGDATAHPEAIRTLQTGIKIQGKTTLPARAAVICAPPIRERQPAIRQRLTIPTSWLELQLREGRNRQVRRMTAAVGLPTLRLVRVAIDLMDGGPELSLDGLATGQARQVSMEEQQRMHKLLIEDKARQRLGLSNSPGRGGLEGGGKSGRRGGGG